MNSPGKPLSNSQPLRNAIDGLQSGKILLLIDDTSNFQICYLAMAASLVTADSMNELICASHSIVCAPIAESRAKILGLRQMVPPHHLGQFDFLTSIEARQGVSTGISAADRAQTVKILATAGESLTSLVTPGHIFPLLAKEGGCLLRTSPVEGLVDLLELASLPPIGVLAHCLDSSGEVLGLEEAIVLAKNHRFFVLRLSEIVTERLSHRLLIEKIAGATLPVLDAGKFRALCFESKIDGAEHLALIRGQLGDSAIRHDPIFVRVQAEHRLGDLLGIRTHPTRQSLVASLQRIHKEGEGVLVYVRHPRRGNICDQVAALKQDSPSQHTLTQLREFGIGAQILSYLGVRKIRLLTNSSRILPGLRTFQVEVVETVPY